MISEDLRGVGQGGDLKAILVPVGGSDADASVFETALALARPLAAHLEFVHVRVTAAGAALHTPHVAFARGAGLASALERLGDKAERRAAAAGRNVADFCARHGIETVDTPRLAPSVTARWRLDEGEPIERLMFHARRHDLTVMARATGLDGLPPDRLEALLLGCGRPLLIAPSGAPRHALGTAMVCWKETRDAARALSAAMPLLARAQRVVVVSVNENAGAPPDALAELVGALGWHGIAADTRVLDRDGRSTADVLFATARACAADLMVMGAYGHRRVREVLFGGCTQSAIETADCPVFLVH
jgi:nucleotide-binding universal stress UspA family protein